MNWRRYGDYLLKLPKQRRNLKILLHAGFAGVQENHVLKEMTHAWSNLGFWLNTNPVCLSLSLFDCSGQAGCRKTKKLFNNLKGIDDV